MSIEKLEKWASVFDVLGNPIRLATLIILYGSEILFEGANSLTFGQINAVVGGVSKQSLTHHLKKLIGAGLITKSAHQKNESGRVYPLYSITNTGTKFLEDFGLKEFIEKFVARKKEEISS
ncbi:MAG: winged helix-turn-helix transcriptional regulator [Methanosarcinales archaeon]